MPLLVLAILAICFVAGVMLFAAGGDQYEKNERGCLTKTRTERYELTVPGFFLAASSLILFVVIVFLWPVLYFSTLNDVNNLEAFSDSTFPAYVYAIEQTEDVEIIASQPGMLDVAYLEQSAQASSRIKELRDKVDWYNSKLEKLRARKATPFGILMYEVPGRLKPIILTTQPE